MISRLVSTMKQPQNYIFKKMYIIPPLGEILVRFQLFGL